MALPHPVTARASWLRALRAWLVAFSVLIFAPLAWADYLAPADSPSVPGRSALALPAVPAGYQVRDAGWLKLAYLPESARWAEPLIQAAQEFRAEVNERLGHVGLSEVHVRLAPSAAKMKHLAPEGAPYPEYAEGVAYSGLGLILLTEEPEHGNAEYDLLTTFRHELAHVALHDALKPHGVPLWFNEGLAIHLSRENAFARARVLWTASVSNNLLPLAEIERRFPRDVVGVPLAYAQSADVVRFLLRTQDQERFRLLIKRVARGQAFDRALYDSYGMEPYNLESAWRTDVQSRFSLWPVLFSGTVLWTLAVVLVTLAWRRKRARQREVLARWGKEEALEADRALAAAVAAVARAEAAARAGTARPEVDLAVAANAQAKLAANDDGRADAAEGDRASGTTPWTASIQPPPHSTTGLAAQRDSQVPKVKHGDGWHTLH